MTDTTAVLGDGLPTVPATKEVSTPEEQKKGDQPTVTEDDKMKEDQLPPFHKHPAWQRQMRRIREMREENREMKGTLDELMTLAKKNAGVEEEPAAPDPVDNTDYDSLLSKEMESLSDTLSDDGEVLSKGDIKEITEISHKYAPKVGKKSIPLPADTAYGIWKDLAELRKPTSPKPNTRPSSRATEGSITDLKNNLPPAKSLHEVVERAKRTAATLR